MDNIEAQKRLDRDMERQSTSYSVIVDGNTHHLPMCIRTKKETVTVQKCKNIVKKVQDTFGIKINKMEISMIEFDYKNITLGHYINACYNDCDIPCIQDKKALYRSAENRLQIWQDGTPIYENNNGEITRDLAALADCLL